MGYTTQFCGEFNIYDQNRQPAKLSFGQKQFIEAINKIDLDKKKPDSWCQWVIKDSKTTPGDALVWDGEEKFYHYEEWLRFLVFEYLKKWGYIVHGSVIYQGDEVGDVGTLKVMHNRIKKRDLRLDNTVSPM